MPVGEDSRDETEKASTKAAVDMSKGVDSAYSFTSSPSSPITNILAPSLENAMPVGEDSCDETGKASTKVAVEMPKGAESVYSFTSLLFKPTTNIVVLSFENAMPVGFMSCDETEKLTLVKEAVERSNGVDSVYSFILPPVPLPITNILVPSLENAMPVGEGSCDETEKASTESGVEMPKGVDNVYSFISPLPSSPITNIFLPSLENTMPVGEGSCDETEKVTPVKAAVETSKEPSMRLPDVSRTAPASTVSSGSVSPATVSRCDAVRLNEIVAPSTVVSSSPAVKVMPPPV